MEPQLPRARKDGLTVEHIEHDLLIYDNVNDQAHSLNRTAALVWKYSDGKRSPDEIARLVGKELGTPITEATVEYALAQLDKSGLLATNETSTPWTNLTRREFMRAATTAAIVVPVVKTIRLPGSPQAASCSEEGGPCDPALDQCCGTLCCFELVGSFACEPFC